MIEGAIQLYASLYLVGLAAFLLIIGALWHQNRKRRAPWQTNLGNLWINGSYCASMRSVESFLPPVAVHHIVGALEGVRP